MLVSFFVSPGVGLFVDNVFREDKCKSLAIAVTGITAFVLIICLASLVKGLLLLSFTDEDVPGHGRVSA